jgi:RNA polymerase sigma-70 factor, ECF subfamily
MTIDLGMDLSRAVYETGKLEHAANTITQLQIEHYLAVLSDTPSAAHFADVYLACGCSIGDRIALNVFEANYVRLIPHQVGHLRVSSDFGDEVQQRVRERLLIADGGVGSRPRIAQYSGQGPLAGFVRATAIRIALDLRQQKNPSAPSLARVDMAIDSADPELAFLQEQHKPLLQAALVESIAMLDEKQRVVLRLHYCAGFSAVRIGTMMGVNHATISRWIIAARMTLFTETRKRLRQQLQLSMTEFQSLVRLVQSQLDISVARVLAAS